MLKITNNREAFYQWDVGQSLTVELAEGETITAVHIGNECCDRVYVVEPIDGLVAVYDELLQSGQKIVAYEYIESETDGHTIRKNTFAVWKRPKATDYAYTPTESYSWEYWVERAKQYAETAQSEVASIPTKMAEWWAIHKPEIMEEIKTAIPPYDDSEIRAEIDGIQQELNDKMEFYKVEAQGAYTNISFYHDGTRLYYNDLVEKYNDPRYFLYAEFEGLTFIPSLPPVDYDPILEFICTWIYGGKPHVARLVINSDNAGKYDGYDVVITGNLNEYTKKTYVDAQLQLKASASELNDVKENLSELNDNVESLETNKVGFEDYASVTKGGVIKTLYANGIQTGSDGALKGNPRTLAQYSSDSNLIIMSKGTLENIGDDYVKRHTKEPQFELIEEITLTEDGIFSRSAEPNGTPYNFKRLHMAIYFPQETAPTSAQSVYFCINNTSFAWSTYFGLATRYPNQNAWAWLDCDVSNGLLFGMSMQTNGNTNAGSNPTSNGFSQHSTLVNSITSIVSNNIMPRGSTVKIYGIRA